MTNQIAIHRSWREHPVIGFSQPHPEKLDANEKRHYKPSEAFFSLMIYDCTSRIDGEFRNGNAVTLDYSGSGAVPNFSAEWNWSARATRAFFHELLQDQLITEELYSALLEKLPRMKARERRRQLGKVTRAAVWSKTNGRCVYCGVALVMTRGLPNSFEADHVLAATRGGSDDIANLVPSCLGCNAKKRTATFMEFIERNRRGTP